MEPQQINPTPELIPDIEQQTSKKPSKILIYLLFILVILGLASWAGIYMKKGGAAKLNSAQEEIKIKEKDGWVRYRDEIFGIEFSYPEYWGSVRVIPENITTPSLYANSTYQYNNAVEFAFSSSSVVRFSIFNNKTNSSYTYSPHGFLESLYSVRQSGSVCDYTIYLDNASSLRIDLLNKCDGEFKKSFIQNYFSDSYYGSYYSYIYEEYAYKRIVNSYYPNALFRFTVSNGQQKSTTTLDKFLSENEDKVNDADYVSFVRSFKSFEPKHHKISKIDIAKTDGEIISLVKNYYNLLADREYTQAFDLLIKSNIDLTKYVDIENGIYDRKIKEINQLEDNLVEVYLKVQNHNESPYNSRVVFELNKGKLNKILEEKINGEIAKFGNFTAYASERGEQSFVVLRQFGKEKIIDSIKGYHDGEWYSRFYSPYFSTSGRYLLYYIGYYEGGSHMIYDTVTGEIAKNVAGGHFNTDETLYFTCYFTEAYGTPEAKIYNVPGFSVKVDLLKEYPNLSRYWNYDCSNDEKSGVETFVFSYVYDDNSFSTTTKEEIRYSSKTGELIPTLRFIDKTNDPTASDEITMQEFISCINKKATLYGAFWSPHVHEQDIILKSSTHDGSLHYIECSSPDAMSQSQLCKDKKITAYPTWEFADGSRVIRKMSIEELGLKTSCEIPN